MEYIIIKKSKMPTAWYADKIGYTFKVDKEISFPNVYTIRISNRKDKANYGTVDIDDAEIMTPTIIDKIKLVLGYSAKNNGA